MRREIVLGAALLLAGCATPNAPTLTVYTNPSAASVTEINGGAAQKSPAVFSYNRRTLNGCFTVRGFTARWISGATANSAPTLQLCGTSANYTVTIDRPTNYPGVEYDIEQAVAQDHQQQENAKELGNVIGQAIGKAAQ